ncbi:MAG: outer membrane beta-barrel protein [Bacteroidota bacterium]
MDDQNFDNEIKKVLLQYEDTTPVSSGWSRMNLPSSGSSVLKPWIWVSVAINVLLLASLPFFLSEIDDLNTRINGLELTDDRLLKQNNATSIPLNPSTNMASTFIPKQTEVKSKGTNVGTVSTHSLPKTISQNEANDMAILTMQPKMIDEDIWQVSTSGQSLIFQNEEETTVEKKSIKVKMNMKVLRDLEKNHFGKGVSKEYGLDVAGSYNRTAYSYNGLGIKMEPYVKLWVHPFWSVKTGLGYSLLDLETQDTELIGNERDKFTSSASRGTLIKSDKQMHLINIPVVLEHHIPWSERSILDVGVGLNQSFQLSSRTSFTDRYEEVESYGSVPRVEYHTYKEKFKDPGFKVFNTNMHYQLGLTRKLKASNWYWGTHLYYEHSLVNHGDISKMNLLGISTTFSRK